MPYTLFWPARKEFEAYTGLANMEEVEEAVREEAEKTVADLGSDGHDYLWPQEVIDVAGGEDKISDWLDTLPENDAQAYSEQAWEAGVQLATDRLVKQAMAVLRQEPKDPGDYVTFKMPDGHVMALTGRRITDDRDVHQARQPRPARAPQRDDQAARAQGPAQRS
jgi:hypothetical protein